MNKKKILTLILVSLAICQVVPYEEPLSFSHDSSFLHNSDLNSSEKLPLELNMTCFNNNICQKKINLNPDKNIVLRINVNTSSKNDKFYMFNEKNEFSGPYMLNKETITTNPFSSNNIILEINTENKKTNLNIIIDEYKPKKLIKNETNYFKSNKLRENPIILITGFWPPTNEMIRHFSQDIQLNPSGWNGENWENRGYDIISYFPEFSDADCSSCGQGYGDFEVDYQNTSDDFWPIATNLQPTAIITFSRGYMDQSWELENNYYNRTNWYNDYSSPFQPTPNPPDENEESFFLRNSNLPMNNIIDAINDLNMGLNSYIDINGDPGHFVSEFMGYHGVWYKDLNQFGDYNCISAGHVHVGGYIDIETAKQATETTIRTLIDYLDEFNYIPGDINEDEIIDVLDLVLIINNILGIHDFNNVESLSADINEDGIINIQDIIILINIILISN